MPIAVRRRSFDAFLSHAHEDRAFVDELYRWLTDDVGFEVWYDAKKMPGGTSIGTGLQKAIEQSRGVILVGSPAAIARGWVQAETNVALDERSRDPDFRIVGLRLPGADLGDLVRGITWIEMQEPNLSPEVAADILRAFHPTDRRPEPRRSRDVYVSISWHDGDQRSGLAACRALVANGFRLIGDAKDQRGFREDRIERIIKSCGAFVSVIPFRGDVPATPTEGPYKYFLNEIAFARGGPDGMELPTVVIADPRVRAADGSDRDWLRMETDCEICVPEITRAIERLWDAWRQPPLPHYIFLATDLDAPSSLPSSDIRELVERITGMETVVGNQIRETPLQDNIMQKIKRAFVVVADITGTTEDTFNVDVCIEAGMARAAGVPLELLAAGRPRRPPFMLRDSQMPTYRSGVEQLGLIHRIMLPFRRRIINAEM